MLRDSGVSAELEPESDRAHLYFVRSAALRSLIEVPERRANYTAR